MIRTTSRLAVFSLLTLLIAACQQTLTTPSPEVTPQQDAISGPPGGTDGWQLAFEDTFEGDTLDSDKWVTCWFWTGSAEQGCINGGNPQLSWVLPRNVWVENDMLHLRAVREDHPTGWDNRTYNWTSGMVTTGRIGDNTADNPSKFAFNYGYMETRVRMQGGNGIYNAFWAAADDHDWPPEIDVFERVADRPDQLNMTHHWRNSDGSRGNRTTEYIGPDYTDTWHTIGALWQPGLIVWYVDGLEIARSPNPDTVPDKDLYLLLSTEVWSRGFGSTGPDEYTRDEVITQVDYVRVWQRPDGNYLTPQDPAEVIPAATFGTAATNPERSYEKAFDGDITTYFDASSASDCYAGVDAGESVVVDMVRYWPRQYQGTRMVGGTFQGADSQEGPWTDLYIVKYRVYESAYTVGSFDNTTPYRYYRYVGPSGGHCNVADVQFRISSTSTNGDDGSDDGGGALADGTYLIWSRVSGKNKIMNLARNSGQIEQMGHYSAASTWWHVARQEDDTYSLTAAHSLLVLEVPDGSMQNVQLRQYDDSGAAHQRFRLEPAGDGYHRIVASHSGKAVDVRNSSRDDGGVIQQYHNNNTPAQHWRFEFNEPLP